MTTDPAHFDQEEAALPGLEPPAAGIGLVEAAARRTIAGLEPQIGEADAVLCQVLVTVARQIDRSVSSGRAKDYAVANLVAQLRETFVELRGTDEGGGDSDPFDALARDLARRHADRRPAG